MVVPGCPCKLILALVYGFIVFSIQAYNINNYFLTLIQEFYRTLLLLFHILKVRCKYFAFSFLCVKMLRKL